MYIVQTSNKFEKDLARLKRRGNKLAKLEHIVEALQCGQSLQPKHRPHLLSGNWDGHWELHIEPDWLLIYLIEDNELFLVRTGTHSDLF